MIYGLATGDIYIYMYMHVYGGFLKWGYPNTRGFNTKMVYFLDDLGYPVPHLRKPPYIEYVYSDTHWWQDTLWGTFPCYLLHSGAKTCTLLNFGAKICHLHCSSIFPWFTRFFHGVHWFSQSVHRCFHSFHWLFHGYNWFFHGFNRFFLA